MIWLAATAIVAAAVVAVAALHLVGRMLREHARERNLMLNQLLHLAGRTWQPPPTPDGSSGWNDDIDKIEERYETSPTQMPNDWGDE